jgi:hypothetical protein
MICMHKRTLIEYTPVEFKGIKLYTNLKYFILKTQNYKPPSKLIPT